MRTVFVLFVLVSSLIGSQQAMAQRVTDQPPVTAEEAVLLSHFLDYFAGMIYDDVCNHTDPKSHLDLSTPENARLASTRQMLTERVKALWQTRHPDEDPDNVITLLMGSIDKGGRAEFSANKGCLSSNALKAKTSYLFYSMTETAEVKSIIDKMIVETGGKGIRDYDPSGHK